MSSFGPLVSADWLLDNLDAVHIFDSRAYSDERSAVDAFASGHITGAVFVDLDADLSSPASPAGGRRPFPTADDFAAVMGRLGYDGSKPAVIYDDVSGGMAARLWFMLTLIGCEAAVLDGGIFAWDGPTSTDSTPPISVSFAPRPWPDERLVSADDVVARIDAGGLVIDARNHSRFIGKPNRIDDRFGHIPGAINLAWEDNIDDYTGRMLDIGQLERRFAPVRAEDNPVRPVAYCGSGVTACHDLLAMELLGVEADLYVGSWSEWGADPARPLATGDDS